MGNIFQCCSVLMDFFRSKMEGGQSLLLSSDGSEYDSQSLLYSLEDDLLTISSGRTNPGLEPEDLMFPDILLSGDGGDVSVVEPMVCLLVSEEEEGLWVGEAGDEREVRIPLEERGWGCSAFGMETQMDVEEQIQTNSPSEVDVLLLRAPESQDGRRFSFNPPERLAESELLGGNAERKQIPAFEEITTSTNPVLQMQQSPEEELRRSAERASEPRLSMLHLKGNGDGEGPQRTPPQHATCMDGCNSSPVRCCRPAELREDKDVTTSRSQAANQATLSSRASRMKQREKKARITTTLF